MSTTESGRAMNLDELRSQLASRVAILPLLGAYNSFMLPRIYISQTSMYTIQLGLELFRGRFGNFWHLVMAASMISILPPIILFFLAQKYFVRGVQLSGLAGR